MISAQIIWAEATNVAALGKEQTWEANWRSSTWAGRYTVRRGCTRSLAGPKRPSGIEMDTSNAREGRTRWQRANQLRPRTGLYLSAEGDGARTRASRLSSGWLPNHGWHLPQGMKSREDPPTPPFKSPGAEFPTHFPVPSPSLPSGGSDKGPGTF